MRIWVLVLLGFVSFYSLDGCRSENRVGGDGGPEGAPFDGEGIETGPFEGTQSGLRFDPPRGIYDAALDVSVTHDTASELLYTLDGSDPRTSDTALTAPLPLTLRVNPDDTTNRYTAPGVVVRGTANGPDALPEQVVTHTYLFLGRVVDLSPDGEAPGPGWPAPGDGGGDFWGGTSQRIDYGLDPEVTESAAYAGQMLSALGDIPSMSLVTDLENLFDAQTGIYMNADRQGDEWERFCSLEMLTPDGSPGFQANAGVRIRGGYSRTPSNPKHAFRFIFRGDYGTPKLRFSLFGTEGVAEFDKIDLRTSQNYAWSMPDDDSQENTMNRDVFSRDLQRELGRPYTRSRYYHLYINGVYWGLFQSQERAEARYAATYFGGDDSDYDVIKVSRPDDYEVQAVDGDLTGWQAVWDLAAQGFASDDTYFQLEGKGPDGNRDTSLPVLVDVDNLIDLMLVVFYTGNFDGPMSKFFENRRPNNFYGINSRINIHQGFVFFAHDNEHTLHSERVSITTGVDENRVSIGEPGGATNEDGNPDDGYRMSVTRPEYLNPQWLHYRLTENASYRARFAARARTLLENNGPLTAESATALFQARADEIDLAIIAESARWGDAHRSPPRTKNDDWLPAVERVKNGFFPVRADIVISQLRASNLY